MEKKKSLAYKFIIGLLRIVYPRMETVGAQNIPPEGALIVGNHTQMNGPIACELYSPVERYTWCAAEMMHWKEVPAYAYRDFWSEKPLYCRWMYKLLSYVIVPLAVIIFNNANTIGVYRDARIMGTFRETVNRLQEGKSVVVFPECGKEYNNIIYDFQEGFIDVARIYHKKTGRELSFVPMYIAPKLRKMYYGKPIRFCSENPVAEERSRIREYLMQEITDMARNLPKHTVIPYKNISKKDYPTNIP